MTLDTLPEKNDGDGLVEEIEGQLKHVRELVGGMLGVFDEDSILDLVSTLREINSKICLIGDGNLADVILECNCMCKLALRDLRGLGTANSAARDNLKTDIQKALRQAQDDIDSYFESC
ncbi:hypothetical protein KKC94_03270 [Patescibacteria group bacterium]|nr:hypothetical protein [Patescibacteria group bacterium]